MGRLIKPLADRFWGKARRAGANDCWPWSGTLTSGRYGSFRVGGRMVRAHRVAYELFHGSIPPGMHVLHRCDNGPCVNPSHLFLGTHDDNMRDMALKGRAFAQPGDSNPAHRFRERCLRGEMHPHAKTTAETVRAVRSAVASGESLSSAAARLGLTLSNASRIVLRKSWKEIE